MPALILAVWTHGNAVPTWALAALTSVLLITPLALASLRTLDASTGAASCALTAATSVLHSAVRRAPTARPHISLGQRPRLDCYDDGAFSANARIIAESPAFA